ncbi:Uncharacterised protein [Legionella pneumophila]|nr:Uncharacterised protein [Legionella pneumophila]CZI42693.1 Uncharacterised protein [Legionella pneumophila]CZJ16100.1 Uncharacterised protein [Legionella pneumophila]CZQ97936.1 Uncharacterised protein [Legionella pneumophila]STX66065.1 Uncharacterised protein [Legionella pneumophila]
MMLLRTIKLPVSMVLRVVMMSNSCSIINQKMQYENRE